MLERSRCTKAVTGVAVWFWVCTAAWGLQTNDKAPSALLLSPVNATWAANNISYWRDKGFDGFILTGIMESAFSASEAERLPARDAADKNSLLPLTREVRLACERLAKAGLEDNFVYWHLAPFHSALSSEPAFADLTASLRLAGMLCSAMGLRGVAIDSASSSGFYHYGWDGYAYDDYTPADLESRARRLGRSLARAVVRGRPGAEILVITDGWDVSGPLWLPFFEGLVEGSSMDAASTVCLLTRESFAARSAAGFYRVARETRAALEARLAPAQLARWQSGGSVGLGLSPLAFDSSSQQPVASVDPIVFRNLVAAAEASSGSYVWIESSESSWWRLTQQDVATYSQLLQNGTAVAAQTRAVVPNLDQYTLKMPYHDWRRVGPLPGLDAPAEVYATESGAALVLWAGTSKSVSLPTGDSPLSMHYISTGDPIGINPEAGATVVPAGEPPLVVEGLSARPWLLQGGLEFQVLEAPTPVNRAAKLACRFRNASLLEIRGSIDLLTSADYAINPANIPFRLAPGELLDASVNVKGTFSIGAAAPVTVSLTVAEGGIITRRLEIQARPETLWRHVLDGDVAGNMVAAELSGGPPVELVACTPEGDITCINAAGGQVWKRRFAAAFSQKPAAGVLASGAPAIALLDNLGHVRLLTAAGETAWERDAGLSSLPPVFASVDEFAGQELLLPFADGRVRALDAGGSEIWTYKPMPALKWLQPTPPLPGPGQLIAVQNMPIGMLAVLSPNARVMWSAIEGVAAPPAVLQFERAGGIVVTATAEGALVARDLLDGAVKARFEPIANVQYLEAGGPGLVAATENGIEAFTPALDPAWSFRQHPAGPPAAGTDVVVAPVEPDMGEPAIVCLDGKGSQVWRIDTGSSVTGQPLLADLDGDGAPECIYTTTARAVTACRTR